MSPAGRDETMWPETMPSSSPSPSNGESFPLESCASSTSEAVSFDSNAFAPYRGGAPAGDFSGECDVARRRLKPRRCPGVDVERCRGRSAGASAAADARCASICAFGHDLRRFMLGGGSSGRISIVWRTRWLWVLVLVN